MPGSNGSTDCSGRASFLEASALVPAFNPCAVQDVQEELAQVARSVNDKVTGGEAWQLPLYTVERGLAVDASSGLGSSPQVWWGVTLLLCSAPLLMAFTPGRMLSTLWNLPCIDVQYAAETTYFKVPFEEVPDLVAGRRVLLKRGFAYVPREQVRTCPP